MSRGKTTCSYCGCTVWYEYQRPHLCADCWRRLRGQYTHPRGAPHAPGCGCTRCVERFGPAADRAYGVRPVALAAPEGHANG